MQLNSLIRFEQFGKRWQRYHLQIHSFTNLIIFQSKFNFFPFLFPKIFSEKYRSNVVNVLSSIKVYPLTYFPHYLHPNNTLFLNGNNDDNDDFDGGGDGEEEAFVPTLGIRSTYPVKLQMPTDINSIVQQNIVLKLVQQKNDYLNDIEKLIGNYKRASQYRSHFNISF